MRNDLFLNLENLYLSTNIYHKNYFQQQGGGGKGAGSHEKAVI